jgi:hypothetical protein
VTDVPWERYLNALPPELAALHRDPPPDELPVDSRPPVSVAELLAVIREQSAAGNGAGLQLREDPAGAGLLAGAWRHVVRRQARAVLALFDAGLASEAAPNARAALEHAVLSQRLAVAADEGALEELMLRITREHQTRQDKHMRYLQDLDAGTGGVHRTLLEETREELARRRVVPDGQPRGATPVAEHFAGLPGGVHFYSVYGRLSEAAHAGLPSAAPYLAGAVLSGATLSSEPAPAAWAEALALLCWSCWAADDAMRRFLVDGDALAARHGPLMARIGLAPDTETPPGERSSST